MLADEDEVQTFVKQMDFFMGETSPLLKQDERNKTARTYYQKWRKVVAENINEILDYRRIVNEANDLDLNIANIESILSEKMRELERCRSRHDDIQTECRDLRELREASQRWAEAAGRIAEKRMQVNQKQLDLSMSTADIGGRDLKTVEQDLAEKLEQKDQQSNHVRIMILPQICPSDKHSS